MFLQFLFLSIPFLNLLYSGEFIIATVHTSTQLYTASSFTITIPRLSKFSLYGISQCVLFLTVSRCESEVTLERERRRVRSTRKERRDRLGKVIKILSEKYSSVNRKNPHLAFRHIRIDFVAITYKKRGR